MAPQVEHHQLIVVLLELPQPLLHLLEDLLLGLKLLVEPALLLLGGVGLPHVDDVAPGGGGRRGPRHELLRVLVQEMLV